ncbi:LacI family DNA-binding transcriptional regulator [Thorsellia kenyensis]|uniref:LacI family DNA-binding transcriptional regulator n=1 Tax=Thorsellia kenyensis TaxID=1549888 RepID=A0ABV6CC83_9GAMM
MANYRINKVTLDNVAQLANVSKVTVSRAFSQPEKVNQTTLKRILDAAEKVGYVVNTAARNLRAKSSKTIGIVTPDLSNPFFSHLAKFMTEEAHQNGYDTLIFDSYESIHNEQNIIDKLIGYGVDAIILAVVSSEISYNPPYFKQLKILGIPVILLDRHIPDSPFSGVYIDNIDCGIQVGRYLVNQKVKKVTIISGPKDSLVAQERVSGIKMILENYTNIETIFADFLMNEAYLATVEHLKKANIPDYFVGCNNQISLGIIKACIEKGLMPQKDFCLFSIDEVSHANIYGFKFPCIVSDLNEIAWQAINMALRRINEELSTIGNVVVRGQLQI